MRSPFTPLVVASLAALLSLASGTAVAQTVPPDVVRTKDGGMLRGTIIEKVPNDHVEIQLPNGQSRTVKMSDVEYAGPASADKPAAPPEANAAPPTAQVPPEPVSPTQAVVKTGMARLTLKADQNGLTFHRKIGTSQGTGTGWVAGTGRNSGGAITMNVQLDNFERLCTAPCAAELPEGTYRLGLSLDDGAVVPAEPPVNAQGSLRLQGHVESYAGVRAGGVVIAIAGGIAGVVLSLQGKQNCDTGVASFCTTEHPYLVHGMVVLGVSSLVGLIMALKKDEAYVQQW
jgi:hypothetical protein